MWRYYVDSRDYTPTAIVISDSEEDWSVENVDIIYNSDKENIYGFGTGEDAGYSETSEGKEFICPEGVSGRYVRVYSNGSNVNSGNHILEFEVWGRVHTQIPGKASVTFGTGNYEYIPEEGYVSPMGFGSDYSFRLIPDEGYYISSVLANGAELQSRDGVYTISNVQEDYTIEIQALPYPAEENLALDKPVSVKKAADGSTADVNEERSVRMAVDGIIPEGSSEGNYCEFGKAADSTDEAYASYLEIDLKRICEISEVELYRFWDDSRVYNGTVIAAGRQTEDFGNGAAHILYNSDAENLFGFGAGTDETYPETAAGLTVSAADRFSGENVQARYIRVYMNGSSEDTLNRIVECKVDGYDFIQKPYAADVEKAEPKMTVNRENPLYVESFYWTLTEEYNGYPQLEEPLKLTPADIWKAVPEEMKPYTVINLIAEQGLRNQPGVTDWIRKYSDICEENGIPFSIQIVNGETSASTRIPLSFIEEFAEKYQYLRGFNAAELYNSPAFYGYGEEGDHSQYVAEIIRICAENGLYWIWTDSNCFGEHGVLQDWIEDNVYLSSMMRTCKEYVIMMYKQTHATIAAEGLDLGLWLADYCDNWGVSSDWWYWGNHKGGLFGAPGTSTTSGNCLFMPEAMFGQDMVRVMSYGGTCFLSEAPFYSNSMGDKRTPAYQYVIIPLFNKISGGEVYIPSKSEVLEKEMTAVVGEKLGDRYDSGYAYAYSINYKQENSQIYPSTSKYNLICSLPENVPTEELSKFAHVFYELPSKEVLDTVYTKDKAEGDAWAEENNGTWYWMNTIENRDEKQYSVISPMINGADSVKIEAGPHTYAVIKEDADRLNVYINNYRVDKSELYGQEFPEEKWYPYLYEQNERMENGTLDDKTLRETVITVKTETEPTIEFITDPAGQGYDENCHTRPYAYQIEKKEGTVDEWEIRLEHNGEVEFDIVTAAEEPEDPSGPEDPVGPEDPAGPEEPSGSDGTEKPQDHKGDQAAHTDTGNKAVETGDASVYPYIFSAVAALGVLLALNMVRIKKLRRETDAKK